MNDVSNTQRLSWRWLVCVAAVLVLLSGCGEDAPDDTILATGFIEGDEIVLASDQGGRVAEVCVADGDPVVVGQVLVRLDAALLQAQRAEAVAAVAAAQANVARVEAGARPAEVDAAAAALAQAEAEREGALAALTNAQQAIDNPQELNATIVAAETEVGIAEQDVEMARADLNEAQMLYNVYAGQGGDVERTWALNLTAARAAVDAAEARLEGTRRYLNALYGMRSNPLVLETDVHVAETEYAIAEAAVEAARAALDEMEAGPPAEDVAVARAQLHQAQASQAFVDAQLAQLNLTSPITGFVSSRSIHAGETAAPGGVLLTLVNLDQVTLVVYIPETQIGRVRVGQSVDVSVDSFPGQTFTGEVTTIATEAEFTPRNVQTQEERVNLVFAVNVVIPNPGRLLKPGMPADAVIRSAFPTE
ncbi:MAG: efflux RND transporter periplasmic adaptor subunit [Anaerolineae bacterium]|nr:efflux RND transporter periplasmic adaptor subunit [Anaerolineae bacterium]